MSDYEYDISSVLLETEMLVDRYTEVLGGIGFVNGIDEIAWQFPNLLALTNFTEQIVTVPGVSLSNSARDHVETLPLNTCYSVQYQFFTGLRSGDHEYRIEAMLLRSGFSPLHESYMRHDDAVAASGWAVHASFKVETEEDYASATHRLREAKWEAAQRCESAYGRFSYWTPLEREAGGRVFLKPRVNLRDDLSPLS